MTQAGRVRYKLRRAWRDGTTAIEFDPLTFIARLAALIPRPGVHLLTYHGLLAPAASYRDRVLPDPPEEPDDDRLDVCSRARSADWSRASRTPRRPRTLWAELLRRVFAIDILRCHCGGRREVLTFLTDPVVVQKILAHLGLPARSPPVAPARPLPESTLAFD